MIERPDPASPDPGRPEPGRIMLLVTSPRIAPGLLSRSGWQALDQADAVLAADPEPGWEAALAEAGHLPGAGYEAVADLPVAQRAGRLVELAAAGAQVVWLSSADGDPGLTDLLAEHLARHAITGPPPTIELLTGSHDLPGARLLDVVAVMDRLRSPGGCPWDAEQTHDSLLPYLLEEAHEVIEVVQAGDRAGLADELGDVLLQVVFHARLAADHPTEPFDVDTVAAGLVDKLVRRHPHVFADVEVDGVGQVAQNWDQIKAAEKPDRGLLDGIPPTLPALSRAQKVLDRMARRGAVGPPIGEGGAASTPEALGEALLALVARARETGVDAESALRAAVDRWALAADG